ncbi:MAG: peptidyl-prolyl cis-trans isomerase [Fimbriimonadaceae bacterium]
MRQFLIAAFACMAIGGSAFAQIDSQRTVITINGEAVQAGEFYERMEKLSGVGMLVGNRFAEAPPGLLTLQRLLEERLLLQLAREQGVFPTEAELKDERDRRIRLNPNILENLSAAGLGSRDLERQILLDVAQFKLQTRGVTVTDQEVDTHYKDNPEMYTTSKFYKLRIIAANSDRLRQLIDSELAAGKSFEEVARQHSVEASRLVGGDIGTVSEGALSEPVQQVLSRTNVGEYTAWIGPDDIKFRFLVEKVTPPKLLPLDDDLRVAIRRQLMLDRGMVRNRLGEEMREMWSKVNLVVNDKQYEAALRTFIETARQTSNP